MQSCNSVYIHLIKHCSMYMFRYLLDLTGLLADTKFRDFLVWGFFALCFVWLGFFNPAQSCDLNYSAVLQSPYAATTVTIYWIDPKREQEGPDYFRFSTVVPIFLPWSSPILRSASGWTKICMVCGQWGCHGLCQAEQRSLMAAWGGVGAWEGAARAGCPLSAAVQLQG